MQSVIFRHKHISCKQNPRYMTDNVKTRILKYNKTVVLELSHISLFIMNTVITDAICKDRNDCKLLFYFVLLVHLQNIITLVRLFFITLKAWMPSSLTNGALCGDVTCRPASSVVVQGKLDTR